MNEGKAVKSENHRKNGEHQLMFESALEKVGGLGRWQAICIFFGSLSCMVAATNHISVIFLGSTPKFSCANWTSDVNRTTGDACFIDINKTTPCDKFIYDQSEYISTLVTEWNLVCGRVYLLPIIQGTYFIGVVLGDLIGGVASDAFGRRHTLMVICVIHMIAAYSAIFVRNYWLYIFVRLFIGGTAHAAWSILNVITIEIISVRHRTLVASVFNTGWKFGFGALALMGYFIRDWPTLQMAIALVNLVMLTYFFIIPESPRWLLSGGRFSEAEAIMRKIGKWNRTDRQPEFESEFQERWAKVVKAFAVKIIYNEDGSARKITFWNTVKEIIHQMRDIMRAKVARRILLLFVWPWFICGLANYGIFLSVKLVSVDKYSLIGITCTLELVLLLLVIYPINKLGRTVCMIITYTSGGLLGMLIMAFPEDSLWSRPILIIFGKALCSINFLGIGLLSKEVFPTSVRNATFGILDACSKVGAAIAPFIVDLLSLVDRGLPNLVIGALTISAVIPFLFLPETVNREIPESIEDMNKLTEYSLVARCIKRRRKAKLHPLQ